MTRRWAIQNATLTVILVGSLTQIQCGQARSGPQSPPPRLDQLQVAAEPDLADAPDGLADYRRLIEQDPLTTLRQSLQRWSNVNSYRVSLHSQERNEGVLGCVRVIDATVMHNPRIVSLQWRENPSRIDQLLWRPGEYDDKLVVRPTGMLGRVVGAIRLDPESDQVHKNSRNDVRELGLPNTLASVIEDFGQARDAGEKLRCMGVQLDGPDGEPALVLQRRSDDPHNDSRTLMVYLNVSNLRPVRVQQFGPRDELLSDYRFLDFQEIHTPESEFTVAALGLE